MATERLLTDVRLALEQRAGKIRKACLNVEQFADFLATGSSPDYLIGDKLGSERVAAMVSVTRRVMSLLEKKGGKEGLAISTKRSDHATQEIEQRVSKALEFVNSYLEIEVSGLWNKEALDKALQDTHRDVEHALRSPRIREEVPTQVPVEAGIKVTGKEETRVDRIFAFLDSRTPEETFTVRDVVEALKRKDEKYETALKRLSPDVSKTIRKAREEGWDILEGKDKVDGRLINIYRVAAKPTQTPAALFKEPQLDQYGEIITPASEEKEPAEKISPGLQELRRQKKGERKTETVRLPNGVEISVTPTGKRTIEALLAGTKDKPLTNEELVVRTCAQETELGVELGELGGIVTDRVRHVRETLREAGYKVAESGVSPSERAKGVRQTYWLEEIPPAAEVEDVKKKTV